MAGTALAASRHATRMARIIVPGMGIRHPRPVRRTWMW